MFAFPGGTVDQGDTLFLGPGMKTLAEATGQTLQMLLVQRLVGAGQRSPPDTEAAALLTQWVIAIQHDAVNAVIATVE